MAYAEQLDELWGVTIDEGRTFVDRNGNLFGILLWTDGHNFFDSKAEAEAFLKANKDAYTNMAVVKLTFNVKVTKK